MSPHQPFFYASNPLDDLLPRNILMTILGFFHDYILCIVPFPSWSDLMQDLARKREEQAGEQEWIAMVMALVAFTAVQVPHQLFPMDKSGVRSLVKKCTIRARAFLLEPYQTVTLNRLFISYW